VSAGAVVPDPVHQALIGEAGECAALAISVYDDDGRYVAVNRRAQELLGYSREELLAHDVGDFTSGGIDRSVLLRSQVREGVRVVERKDGTTFPAAFVVAPTRLAGLDFFVSVWWEIAPEDPRAGGAT
jgi:PAS domain S-box-containing protein